MAGFEPPPSYCEATRQHASLGGNLTFVDFIPQPTESGIFNVKFEPFGVLIEQANAWLSSNPSLEVKTCESIEFKCQGRTPMVEKMTYLEFNEYGTRYIRGLRLWVVPRSDARHPPQKIGYLNLVPQPKEPSSLFGTGQFKTLSDILEKFNKSAATNPPGRILSIESQEMKLPSWSNFDPDRSSWTEHGRGQTHFLFVVRIFFEYGPPAAEEIGIADFVPVMLADGGLFSIPQFEPFSNVIARASQWCEQQRFLRFCNAQSLEIKMKGGAVVDTQRMSYTEHGGKSTYYVRVLRVTYTKPAESLIMEASIRTPVLHLTCKTFIPYQLNTSMFIPEFESLTQTKERMKIWVQLTGARMLSAETVAMRLLTGGEATSGIEASFTYNPANMNEYWIYIIRLYLDGYYKEPEPHLLPPPPPVVNKTCAIL
ncbi:uncharacterized protein [Centruroides vittatus]|uniref:uncharacterized protein isoform X1 n=1 Tax=Centruroides vittatus TaxID=120091 RepID=UPI00350EEC02